MAASGEPEHLFIQANGIRMHVARTGAGSGRPLLLFLHGFPECWYSWRHQLRAFGDRFECAAPDLRGYGQTERPADGYDLDTLARDAVELIRALGHERAAVIGHDWGGAVAWHIAERHPDAITHFAALNCPPADVVLAHMLRSPSQIRRSWYMFFFQLPALPEHRLSRDGARIVPRIFKACAVRRDAFSRHDLDIFRREMARPGAAEAALAYYRTAARAQLHPVHLLRRLIGRTPRRRPITAPSLIAWGRNDPMLEVSLTHGLEERFAGPLTIRYIDRCGHWTQQEAPDEVNEALTHLLDAAPTGGPAPGPASASHKSRPPAASQRSA